MITKQKGSYVPYVYAQPSIPVHTSCIHGHSPVPGIARRAKVGTIGVATPDGALKSVRASTRPQGSMLRPLLKPCASRPVAKSMPSVDLQEVMTVSLHGSAFRAFGVSLA